MAKIYTTTASVVGARNGTAKLSDDDKTYNMVSPGSKEDGNNPEQFFAMGYVLLALMGHWVWSKKPLAKALIAKYK